MIFSSAIKAKIHINVNECMTSCTNIIANLRRFFFPIFVSTEMSHLYNNNEQEGRQENNVVVSVDKTNGKLHILHIHVYLRHTQRSKQKPRCIRNSYIRVTKSYEQNYPVETCALHFSGRGTSAINHYALFEVILICSKLYSLLPQTLYFRLALARCFTRLDSGSNIH